jgi:hypothetical protein
MWATSVSYSLIRYVSYPCPGNDLWSRRAVSKAVVDSRGQSGHYRRDTKAAVGPLWRTGVRLYVYTDVSIETVPRQISCTFAAVILHTYIHGNRYILHGCWIERIRTQRTEQDRCCATHTGKEAQITHDRHAQVSSWSSHGHMRSTATLEDTARSSNDSSFLVSWHSHRAVYACRCALHAARHSHKVFGSIGSRYVVCYSREIFTLYVENEPVNPDQGQRTRVEGRRWWTRFTWLCAHAVGWLRAFPVSAGGTSGCGRPAACVVNRARPRPRRRTCSCSWGLGWSSRRAGRYVVPDVCLFLPGPNGREAGADSFGSLVVDFVFRFGIFLSVFCNRRLVRATVFLLGAYVMNGVLVEYT